MLNVNPFSKTVLPSTSWLLPDEKIFALFDTAMTPTTARMKGKGLQRYRFFWVNRADHMAVYMENSSTPVSAPSLSIPCLWEHSAAEASDMANNWSTRLEWEQDMLAEKQAQSTLIADISRQIENDALMIANKSTFGPLGKIQRNGFPQGLRSKNAR